MDRPTERTPAEIVGRGYDAVSETYAELEGATPWPRMRWVRTLLAELGPGSAILELGCGNGLPATRELARSHDVVGADVSERQVEFARANVPRARFLHADAMSLSFAPATFDAVVALYVVDHIPRSDHGTLYERIHEWLKPGGHLLLSVEPEAQEDRTDRWLGVEMFFSSLDADETRALITSRGFSIRFQAIEEQDEGGRPVTFLWILARREDD